MNTPIVRTVGIDVHKDTYSICTFCPETDSFCGELTVASDARTVISYVRKRHLRL
jgi:hypothetical protein